MNKYKLLIVAIGSLFAFNSCYDLDRFPSDQLSESTFFKTQDHADQAMMGVYSVMHYWDVFGRQFGFDCLGGIAMGYDAPSYQVIQRGNYTYSTNFVTEKYKHLYEGVARANIVLQNVDNCEMSSELIERYKGEAKFMRALYYFTLLDFYGGVPIYDENTVVAEEYMTMQNPRETVEKVREFVLNDLETAIKVLPDEWDQDNYGRATSLAAAALKGKVLLYNKQYSEAASAFEAVINSGKHTLYPDYENLFKPGGDESSEMIFAMQSLGGVGQDLGIPTTFFLGSRSSYGSCWNNVMAATDFVDSYEWNDGRPFDWEEVIPGFTNEKDHTVKDQTFRAVLSEDKTTVISYPEAKQTLLDMYEKRDPRMAISLILPYTQYKGWVSNAKMDSEYIVAVGASESNGHIRVNNNYETYLWRKFVAEYDMDGMINDRRDTPINYPLIRYADVLLMLAECYNELDKPAEAVAKINEVRARVGMPGINSGPSYLAANSKEEIFKRIRHERAVELSAEGHSFSDMRRWGILEELNGKKEYGFTYAASYYERSVTSRDYLWPIPKDAMDRNPNLTQNPGW